MAIAVRPAVDTDLAAILGLYGELHPSDKPLTMPDAERTWREIRAQPGRTTLVAVRDRLVIGTIDCTVLANLTRGGRSFMLVENVVVGSRFRRAGAGTRLLGEAMAIARAANCYKVQLLSRSDRVDAHAFYESVGFRPAAVGYRVYLN